MMFRFQLTNLRYVQAFAILLCLILTLPLNAQTRFERPDTAADLRQYKTPEECLSAVERETGTFKSRLPFWIDTTELVHREELQPLSASAIAAAKWCAEKFDPRTVSLDEHLDWVSLFLAANRDDAADIVMERRLSIVKTEPKDSSSYILTLDTLLSRFFNARPMRYQKIIDVVHRIEASNMASMPRYAIRTYSDMFRAADIANDTITQEAYAQKIVTFADALSEDIKGEGWYQISGRYDVVKALDYLVQRVLIDSLRRSAQSYVALKQSNWKRARGQSADPLPFYVGQTASTIHGDYWYHGHTSNTATDQGQDASRMRSAPVQRPTPGKLALVAFLLPGCHDDHPGVIPPHRESFKTSCWTAYALIRRMKERFPDLEITLVSSTTGYLAGSRPLEPQAEADLMEAWWLGYHRLPGTLAVTNTSFFRLDGLDHRRVDNPLENEDNYTFSDKMRIRPTTAYLVDPTGTVLLSQGLLRWNEQEFRKMIEVVTERMR